MSKIPSTDPGVGVAPNFNITVIGAGIGGLAVATVLSQQGHHVHILESLAELSEIGAGIQITPNALRIFDKWGLKDVLYEEGAKNDGAEIRRYDDGRVLGRHRGNPVESYGYFNLTLHRADYQRILFDAALTAGVKIDFGKKVVSIDQSIPSVTLEDGSIITTDLIIAADGIGSKIRTTLFPDFHAQPTRDCAYRIILPRSALLSSPILSPLITAPTSLIWFGPQRHIVGYTMRHLSLLNLVFCGPGTADVGVWNEPADLGELRKEYEGWEETVRELLGAASSVHKWKIGVVPDLPSWRSESGRVVLLGDAAHATMPYTAQGATMAIEDSAVLAGCLSRANSRDKIPELMKAYEEIRKPRAEKVKATSEGNMRQYGMEDGPEQVARDEMYKNTLVKPAEIKEKKQVVKADMNATYGSPGFSKWLYAYDTDEELRQYFDAESKV